MQYQKQRAGQDPRQQTIPNPSRYLEHQTNSAGEGSVVEDRGSGMAGTQWTRLDSLVKDRHSVTDDRHSVVRGQTQWSSLMRAEFLPRAAAHVTTILRGLTPQMGSRVATRGNSSQAAKGLLPTLAKVKCSWPITLCGCRWVDAAKSGHVSTHHHGVLLVFSCHNLQLVRRPAGRPPLAEEVLQRRRHGSEGS